MTKSENTGPTVWSRLLNAGLVQSGMVQGAQSSFAARAV